MSFEALLIITVVVAALGTMTSQIFRNSDSPYLLTVYGTRSQLIITGAMIWFTAVAAGLIGLLLVASVMSGVVAFAIFFGIEAVALDICAHRINYKRTEQEQLVEVRIDVLHRN